jgi:GNAT superfamily N-acetyltransferase
MSTNFVFLIISPARAQTRSNRDKKKAMTDIQTIQHNHTLEFRELTLQDSDAIVPLAIKLRPNMDPEMAHAYLADMFTFPTYHCFGLWQNGKLVGMSNGWITVRFYSGKQLEVDNVVVDPDLRSKGVGKYFFVCIQDWAVRRQCNTIELNTYVQNSRSHKFYCNEGYSIVGFHMQKFL